jgi:putative addiction module killer protein
MLELLEYLDGHDRSPFAAWFNGLNAAAAAKVTAHLTRIELGNLSNVEPVGGGVLEKKVDWGPGYRIYFGRDGNTLVILLGGSQKKDQRKSIESAKLRWSDYKTRKKVKTHGTD